MATYDVDVYGKNSYGRPLYTVFDTGYMRAEPTDYGQLQVDWGTPLQVATSAILSGPQSWTLLRLVRNSYGIPDAEDDGLVCLEVTASGAQNSFVDTTVKPGNFYYYAIFVAVPLQLWSSSAIYQPGNVVTYSSVSYQCLAVNTTSTVPGTDGSIWAVVGLTATWARCGGVVGLATERRGHGEILYDLIPRPYKVERVESTASSIAVNDQLFRFCQMFGYHLDVMKSENDALLHMNNILRCTDGQLNLIAGEMGIIDRMPGLPELRRSYVRDAVAIQRGKGTPGALAELIRSLTGWDAQVQIGYNELHDMDEAAFANPVYPAWDASAVYRADSTLGTGDRVMYLGGIYQARGAVTRLGGYLLYLAGSVTQPPTSALVGTWGAASAYRNYVESLSQAQGTVTTVTFNTPPTGAGDYNIAMRFLGGPTRGVFDIRLNGSSAILSLNTDLYSSEFDSVIAQGFGRWTLNATGTPNTLTFTATGKNRFSSGFDLALDYIELTPYGPPAGVHPTGDATSSQYWTSLAVGTATDISTLHNFTTHGYSNWNMLTTAGTVNPIGTQVPVPSPVNWWVAPLAAGVGTGALASGNSLVYSNPSGAAVGPIQLMTCGWTQGSTWVPFGESTAGAVALWPAGGPVWMSNSAPHVAVPGEDFGWDVISVTNGVNLTTPEPWLVQRQAVPIRRLQQWRASATYSVKDQVAWVGHRYEAALPVSGAAPSGTNADTQLWRWIGPDVQQYTWSLYHSRTATGTGQHVRPYITWLDSYGNVLATSQVQNSQQLLYDRFEVDGVSYPYGGTPSTWTTPSAWQQGTGVPWSQNWGTWTTGQNLIYPVAGSWTIPSGTTTATALSIQQAGMHVSFLRSAVNSGSAGEQVYATFVSAPVDAAALGTLEHGVVFRLAAGAGYWMASRDRLTYIANATNGTPSAFPSPSQTPTVVASWTSIPNHTRMRVTNSATGIQVHVMYPTAPGTWTSLASVSDSTHYQTQTGYGLMERVRQ